MQRPQSVPVRTILVLALAVVATGCGDDPVAETPAARPAGEAPSRAASTLPIPGATPAAPPAGRHAGLLRWDAPERWNAETPRSDMRLAQYEVPGAAGSAECVVYYFGPGQGGDPMANVMRWAGQFRQPDGTDSRERMRIEPIEGARYPTRLVSVTGTYDGGMTMTDMPSPEQPGAMLLGAIVEGPDAPWFFKLTGPEATVAGARDEMVALLRSLQPAGA